jgi:hypothetical protein
VRPSAFLKTNTSKSEYQQETCAPLSFLFTRLFARPKKTRPQITADDIKQIIKWLADLWLTNEEVRKIITEDEWLKFIEAVIQAAKEQIYN